MNVPRQKTLRPGSLNILKGLRRACSILLSSDSLRTAMCALVAVLLTATRPARANAAPLTIHAFVQTHCTECHDADAKKGGLDLTALSLEPENPRNFAAWVKVYDRVNTGEMPPKKKERPKVEDIAAFTHDLGSTLVAVDQKHAALEGRA